MASTKRGKKKALVPTLGLGELDETPLLAEEEYATAYGLVCRPVDAAAGGENVTVVLRVRPMSSRNSEMGATSAILTEGNDVVVEQPDAEKNAAPQRFACESETLLPSSLPPFSLPPPPPLSPPLP